MRLVWIIALVLANTTIASACPPGPCLKYRHIQHVQPVRANAVSYARSLRARPPTNPRAIAEFLTRSVWLPQDHFVPQPGVYPALPIRFLDARQVQTSPNRTDERVVLVRRIDRRDRITMVEVDGQVFELSTCRDTNRQWTSCLTMRTDLSFDVPEQDPVDDGHFAQPPP
jgi:hypothetical protein